MSWLTNIWRGFQDILNQNTKNENTATEPVEAPPVDLSHLTMAGLRAEAASRDLGDGRYKGLSRAQLTELITKGERQ
jgi:hypothetical protein